MKAMKNSKEYASETSLQWNSIDWNLMEKKVKTLQARIVKAQQARQHRKVCSLQWILTNSFAAKALAVRKVTSNAGKRTAGVDGVIWSTDASKMKAIQLLRRKGYRPLPLRRVYIPKSNGKKRPLSIPCMKDRAMQALYLMSLDPIGETVADKNSYGFRPKRSCADAIEQCFQRLASKIAPTWVLDADIKGCFDNISHQWLLENIPMDKRMLRLWLNGKIIDGQTLFHSQSGTPQGGIISPWLANMVLNGMETVLDTIANRKYNKQGEVSQNKFKVYLCRYADDFIITANDDNFLKEKVIPAIEAFLQPRGLALSPEKTHIKHIEEGFDFLGQNIRKYKGNLFVTPSKKNMEAVKKKIKTIISNNKAAPQSLLIHLLNPVIRGWANYHRHVSSKKTFNDLDHYIFSSLWNWSRRRHTEKSLKWIKRKYFLEIGGNKWTFACFTCSKLVRIQFALAIPIKRHLKIKGYANPYSKDWQEYFDKRKNTHRLMPSQLKLKF